MKEIKELTESMVGKKFRCVVHMEKVEGIILFEKSGYRHNPTFYLNQDSVGSIINDSQKSILNWKYKKMWIAQVLANNYSLDDCCISNLVVLESSYIPFF